MTDAHPPSPPPDPAGDADDDAPPMPSATDAADAQASDPGPPPTFARQVAQLVLIPALIVIAAVAIIYPIARIASSRESVAHLTAVLARSGGVSNDRWQAAYRLAMLIPTLADDRERRDLSAELSRILHRTPIEADGMLHRFLIVCVARLAQPDSLETVLAYADAPATQVRYGVAQSLRQWHDPAAARAALPALIGLLADDEAEISGVAASAIGLFAGPDDIAARTALRGQLERDEPGRREAVWDAAIALARLGDAEGAAMVADLLLDREALSRLPSAARGSAGASHLPVEQQDRIILATLTAAIGMTDDGVWTKIRRLAEQDPNRRVQAAARQLVYDREGQVPPQVGPD